MTTVYPSLKIGATARLAMFKREAANGKWARPMTWRDVRFATLKSDAGLHAGFNGEGFARVPVWYTQDGQFLARETFCDEVEGAGIRHTGWFTDEDQSDKVRGIVVALPHGRFLAGYLMSMNDERVYFADIHDSAKDAARMADEHARVIGEAESEHNARWREARDVENGIEDSLKRLRECIVLRHSKCMEYVRDEVNELIEKIRKGRDTLATDYKGVL